MKAPYQALPVEDTVADERYLFLAVIAQAVEDTANVNLKTRSEAREWLVERSADFRLVCSLAGLDADMVAEAMDKRALAGWPATEKEVENEHGTY